jgi:hypothetical protein
MTALTTIEQASPEWLTEVLRRRSCLPSGRVRALSVRRVHAEQVQDFWGMFVRPALTGFRDLGCAELLRSTTHG